MNWKISSLLHRASLWLAAICLVVFSCANLPAQTGITQVIASTGSAAPGVSGGTFNFPGTPTINNSGKVAFYASLQIGGSVTSGNEIGIWGPDPSGNLSLIARTGSSSGPAVPNAVFATLFEGVKLNDQGNVAFAGTMQEGVGGVTTGNKGGIWSNDSSGLLSLKMRMGSGGVPGVPGANFSSVFDPLLNNFDQLLFLNKLQTGVAGVTSSNDTGIWGPDANGNLSLIVRNGSGGVPGIAGANFDTFGTLLNDNSKTAFAGQLVVGIGGVTASNNRGVWGPNAAGTLSLIARTGSGNVPGVAGASFSSLGGPALTSSGRVAFYGELTGVGTGTRGIWRQDASGNLGLFVRSDSGNVPGVPGTSFNAIDGTSLRQNDAGDIAFVSTITNNRRGVWSTDYQGNLKLVAGADFIDVPNAAGVTFAAIDSPAMNDLGTIAFYTTLGGNAVQANNKGIFIGDGIELIKVVRTGDVVFGLNPVDTLNIPSFNGESSGNDGRQTGLNNFGQVTYSAGAGTRDAAVLWTPDLHWRGTANDGDWNNRGNFTLSLVPGFVHRVFLDPASDLTIIGPTGTATVKDLQIGSAAGAANLQLAAGSTLTVTNLLDVRPNGQISGTGTLVSSFTIKSGAKLSPGVNPTAPSQITQAAEQSSGSDLVAAESTPESNSNFTTTSATGTLNFVGNQTWGTGGVMAFQIGDATGTSGGALGWDLVSINGSLTITATTSQKFLLDIDSVLGSLYGNALNFNPAQSYTWTYATASGGITGFNPNVFALDLNDFTNPYNGTFSLAQQGNSLNLVYTAVPEPSVWITALLGTVGLLGVKRAFRVESK